MNTTSSPAFSMATDQMPGLGAVSILPSPLPRSPFSFPRPTDEHVKNAKITIVDDESTVAYVVRSHLQEAGFRHFDLIFKSSAAIDRIQSTLPDLVLLDLRMRPTSGWKVLESLRRDEATQNIPIVILTSATDEESKITALNLGANDFLTKPVAPCELVARVRNTLASKVYRDLMTNYSMQLESDVLRDALTGIANRRAFEYELKRRIVEWSRQRIPLGMMMIDIDHFKAVNDRFGHQVGDRTLRQVAHVLLEGMREMDLVARYGGEEFAVILPHTTPRDARSAAERTREAIDSRRFHVGDHDLRVAVSIGVASALRSDDADLIIARADAALYTAKREGRNCCYYHDGGTVLRVTPASANARPELEFATASTGVSAPQLALDEKYIAIVDDEPHIIALVRKYLKDAGYSRFLSIPDATTAVSLIKREEPDLVLLDIHMPQVSGFDILKTLHSDNSANAIPVLIFTSSTDKDTKVRALQLGAADFLEKPLHVSELVARVRNTLIVKSHLDFLADYSSRLEQDVKLRTSELAASRREAIQCLARAAELRDDHTGQHVLRVGRYAALIADELGFSEDRTTWLEHAAQLHDVGKIGVPDSVLKKRGQLTQKEFQIMQRHCHGGSRIIRDERHGTDGQGEHINIDLGDVIFGDLNSPVMRMAALVAETHHERWDGTGYPRGLAGNDIPIEGRITAVADVFDALSTERPYKDAIPLDQCFKIMAENRGTHFDPRVLDAFFRRKSDVVRIYLEYSDTEV